MLQLVLLLGFAPASLHPSYLLAFKGRLLQSLTLHTNDVLFVIAQTPSTHPSCITKKTTRTAGGLSIIIQTSYGRSPRVTGTSTRLPPRMTVKVITSPGALFSTI